MTGPAFERARDLLRFAGAELVDDLTGPAALVELWSACGRRAILAGYADGGAAFHVLGRGPDGGYGVRRSVRSRDGDHLVEEVAAWLDGGDLG